MPQYIRRAAWPALVALAVTLAACSGEKKADDSALSQDTALARDLARVGGDTAVQPQLQDVPAEAPLPEPEPAVTPPAATPAPSKPRPRTPAPKPNKPTATTPEPTPAPTNTTPSGNTVEKGTGATEKMGTVAAGTMLNLGAADKVCTNTNKIGDRFIATLNESVTGADGAVIPAGAVIGQILGKKSKSTIIGAAAGAAAGGAAAAATANYEGCVNAGGRIAVKLNAPVTVAVK